MVRFATDLITQFHAEAHSRFNNTVAVSGLPDPRRDHAVAMARFADDIIRAMSSLTKELEVRLGLGTADLGLRVG